MYPTNLHLFERFRLADRWNGMGPEAFASLHNGNCGSSHFPPTSRRDTDEHYHGDYAYYDLKTWQQYIDCSADDWLHFPATNSATRKLNGYDYGAFNRYTEGDLSYADSFGASPELHPSFWSTLPPIISGGSSICPTTPASPMASSTTGGRTSMISIASMAASIDYPVTDSPEIPTNFPPVNGEYGTDLPTAEWWGYWCSFSDFGPYGRVSVVSNAANPTLVSKGALLAAGSRRPGSVSLQRTQ